MVSLPWPWLYTRLVSISLCLSNVCYVLVDHVFDETSNSKDLYDGIIKQVVISAMQGINGTTFPPVPVMKSLVKCWVLTVLPPPLCSQELCSGAGRLTSTMTRSEPEPGVIPLTMKEISHYSLCLYTAAAEQCEATGPEMCESGRCQ